MCLPVKPYKVEREWEHLGLQCAVVLTRPGFHRCGYVRVPPGHPSHGKDYNEVEVDVHGGLTFGQIEPCDTHKDGIGYWLGFDCAHHGDSMLNPDPTGIESKEYKAVREIHVKTSKEFGTDPWNEHYWTQEEVERETERLAEQLAAMVASPAP
jgi:hypothetical protein